MSSLPDQEQIQQLQSQIDELQARTAYFEDTLQQLNDVVSKQDEEIRELHKIIQILNGRIKNLPEGDGEKHSLRDEIPPHY
ncbi:MAG: SlyX family protein [Cellvibrionaceae bacterium]